jgi:hypothetical protein
VDFLHQFLPPDVSKKDSQAVTAFAWPDVVGICRVRATKCPSGAGEASRKNAVDLIRRGYSDRP